MHGVLDVDVWVISIVFIMTEGQVELECGTMALQNISRWSVEELYRCNVPAVTIIALNWLRIVGVYFIQPHMRVASSSKQMLISGDLKFVDLKTGVLWQSWLYTMQRDAKPWTVHWSDITSRLPVPVSQGIAVSYSKARWWPPRILSSDHTRQWPRPLGRSSAFRSHA